MTPEATPSRLGYIPALDGLRGIAVLLVCAFHFGVPGAQGGFLGVDIFFVLSGYLITFLLLSEWLRTGRIRLALFYVRRALRLVPALVLLLLAVVVMVPTYQVAASLGGYANWVMAAGDPSLQYGPLGHIWALSMETQFYLLWPASLLLFRRHLPGARLIIWPLALLVVLSIWRLVLFQAGASADRLYAGTDTHSDGLLLGSVLAIGQIHGLFPAPQRMARLLTPLTLVALAFLSFEFITATPDTASLGVWAFLGVALAVTTLVGRTVVYPQPTLVGFLSMAPLVLIGRMSYGIYLWHLPIAHLIGRLGVSVDVWGLVLRYAVTLAVAAFSYRYVERPFLRLKSRFSAGAPYSHSQKPVTATIPQPSVPAPPARSR